MKRLLLVALLLASSVSVLHAQRQLRADSGHFIISQGSHPVGRSDFSIQPVRQGSIAVPGAYSVTSHGTLNLQKTQYSFSANGSLDQNLAILSENLNGVVNGSAVTFVVQQNAGNFAVDISANGKSSQNSLNRPGQAVFFPDFDLSSYEILLAMNASRPGASISALIPKQTGILLGATLAPQADVQATLNGTALTVHHSSLTIGNVVSELYYSSGNRVLEVDIPGQTFAMVHENFRLQPPPPPPANASPNAQQQQPGSAVAPSQPQ